MAVITTAVAMWVLVIGGDCVPRPESLASDSSHTVTTPVGGEFTIILDHPHLVDGDSWGIHPEAFAAGVLPNSSSAALAALGVVVAVVAVTAWLAQHLVLAGRGPPRGLATALTGQDLLTRFCLSRR
ncbi:hypothetical protein [Mycobacterium intracellulare]|uniref:hypothetical protein n=1 Tax=Mycobacterium intracellulare TaxID=1767 RepID=UPI0009F38806|nr:hypothetical protein [Mycobacterium intracellulare]